MKRGEVWSVAARGAYTGTTVRRTTLRERIRRLADEDIARLDRAIIVFLGVTQGRARGAS